MARWPAMTRRLAGKGSRGLPGWLFDSPPPEQQAQLDQIRVFGLDVVRERSEREQQSTHSSEATQRAQRGDEEGSGERSQASHKSGESQPQSLTPPLDDDAGPIEVEIPPVASVASQPPPTPPMSSSPAPQPPFQQHQTPLPPRHRTPHHPDPSSDDEIAVRPLRQRARPPSFEDTPAPEPSRPSTREGEGEEDWGGETSESELSEYERQRRRAMKARAVPSQDSQSLSQSQDSREFDLARYEFPLSMPVDTPLRSGAAGTRSMPPLSRSSPASERAGDKRGRADEDDCPPPAQRPRTEEPSARSWRELAARAEWGEMGPPSGQAQVTPVKSEFVSSEFVTQRLLTPTPPSAAPTAKEEPPELEPPEAAPPEPAPQPEAEVKAETTDESTSLPKPAPPDQRHPPRPQFDHNSHESLAPRPSPRRVPPQSRARAPFVSDESGSGSGEAESKPELESEPEPRSELLGGWKPNLTVRGLNAEWVRKVTRAAEDVRDRRRVKREG